MSSHHGCPIKFSRGIFLYACHKIAQRSVGRDCAEHRPFLCGIGGFVDHVSMYILLVQELKRFCVVVYTILRLLQIAYLPAAGTMTSFHRLRFLFANHTWWMDGFHKSKIRTAPATFSENLSLSGLTLVFCAVFAAIFRLSGCSWLYFRFVLETKRTHFCCFRGLTGSYVGCSGLGSVRRSVSPRPSYIDFTFVAASSCSKKDLAAVPWK